MAKQLQDNIQILFLVDLPSLGLHAPYWGKSAQGRNLKQILKNAVLSYCYIKKRPVCERHYVGNLKFSPIPIYLLNKPGQKIWFGIASVRKL